MTDPSFPNFRGMRSEMNVFPEFQTQFLSKIRDTSPQPSTIIESAFKIGKKPSSSSNYQLTLPPDKFASSKILSYPEGR